MKILATIILAQFLVQVFFNWLLAAWVCDVVGKNSWIIQKLIHSLKKDDVFDDADRNILNQMDFFRRNNRIK